jgi:hypothetical protein
MAKSIIGPGWVIAQILVFWVPLALLSPNLEVWSSSGLAGISEKFRHQLYLDKILSTLTSMNNLGYNPPSYSEEFWEMWVASFE